MKVSVLNPRLPHRVQFRQSETLRVPENSGCYALTSINDEVIYIGQSKNLYQRMQQHLDSDRMTQSTYAGLAVWFYYQMLPPEKLELIESRLLFVFKAVEGRLPPLNRMGP